MKARAPLVDSRTVVLDGFSIRLASSTVRGQSIVSVLQQGRVIVVGRANREQLAEIIDAACARRGAMQAPPSKEQP